MEIVVGVGAVQTVQKSSKSEPSSRFFGRLKIFAEKFAVHIAEGGSKGGGLGRARAAPGPSVVGSIGSIIRSVRSIIVQPTSVDRFGQETGRAHGGTMKCFTRGNFVRIHSLLSMWQFGLAGI